MQWSQSGSKKIVLKGTQEQIQMLSKEREARYIIDAGKTQIEAGSLTAVGFFPSCTNVARFSMYKLL